MVNGARCGLRDKRPQSSDFLRFDTDEEVALDDGGELRISDVARDDLHEKIEADLRRDWPAAGDEQIEAATAEVLEFRLHTIETGRMSYAEAQRLGQHVVELLQPAN